MNEMWGSFSSKWNQRHHLPRLSCDVLTKYENDKSIPIINHKNFNKWNIKVEILQEIYNNIETIKNIKIEIYFFNILNNLKL